MSWGVSPWGNGQSWGLGATGPLEVVRAIPISFNTLRVTLNQQPNLEVALNPDTWIIQNLTTLEFTDIVAVAQASPTVFDLLTLTRSMVGLSVTYEVQATGLINPIGQPATVTTAQFLGLQESSTQRARREEREQDLANPPFKDTGNANILQIQAGGDYEKETGEQLLRKLIIRRLSTKKGEFAHLPDYGLGLSSKELVRPAELPRLRKEFQDELELEANIERVRTRITWLPAQGILRISVQARIVATQEDVSTTVDVPQDRILEL